jgi:N-acyl-D-amino-acid deacylase
MAPHQPIRYAVMGWDDRPPAPGEMDRMRALTRDWMEAGAVGLNTGLDYQPAANSTTDELVELARVVREYGGIYAAHIRYNALGKTAAYRESIEIGQRLRDDPAFRRRIGAIVEEQIAISHAAGGREYFSETRTGRYIGQSIAEVAAERGASIGETAVDLIIEESPDAILVFRRGITPEAFDAQAGRTLNHPAFMVASDGVYHGALPHPRGYGTYVQVLGTFVRQKGLVSLERAVHLMSGLPAERFGIKDRGRVSEGLAADLVVFDPATVASRATWDEPRRTAVGVDAVLVNGELVARDGRPTSARPGRVIRAAGRH